MPLKCMDVTTDRENAVVALQLPATVTHFAHPEVLDAILFDAICIYDAEVDARGGTVRVVVVNRHDVDVRKFHTDQRRVARFFRGESRSVHIISQESRTQ